MFGDCNKLKTLDISQFKLKNTTNTLSLFASCEVMESIKMPAYVQCDIDLPFDFDRKWKDENGKECEKATKDLDVPMKYTRVGISGSDDKEPEDMKPDDAKPEDTESEDTKPDDTTPDKSEHGGKEPSMPKGEKVASFDGNSFYKDSENHMRCYDKNGNLVTNKFKCDGTYTYYFQANGTAMTDRLSYHPDGKHVIYFDENGHEIFNDFVHVRKSISGDTVDDVCFFDVFGHMYVDVITYDKLGKNLYYVNVYGVVERNGWFQFSDGNMGYANQDGTLCINQFGQDEYGRMVYFQANGQLAKGLIFDGKNYYQMDEIDGHCIGQF